MNIKKVSNRLLATVGFAVLVAVSIPVLAHAEMLSRQLDLGMTGSDVSSLQSFLARDVTIYPQGLVTGYFGSLTHNAVANFQVRNGIPSVGRVGPITLVAINSQMSGVVISPVAKAPIISGVGISTSRNSAVINWNTDEMAKGVVYYSTTPLVMSEQDPAPVVYGNTAMTDMNLHGSQSILVSNLQANTTYYYLVYTTDQDGNVSVTWPGTFQTSN